MKGLNQGHDLVGVPVPGVDRAVGEKLAHHRSLQLVAVAGEDIIGKNVIEKNHRTGMGGQEAVAEVSVGLVPGMEAIQKDQIEHLAVPMIPEVRITRDRMERCIRLDPLCFRHVEHERGVDSRLGSGVDFEEGEACFDADLEIPGGFRHGLQQRIDSPGGVIGHGISGDEMEDGWYQSARG